MTNPKVLLASVAEALQDIPELVELLGDADAIRAYYHQWPDATSWLEALRKLKPPGILVDYLGVGDGLLGQMPARVHSMRLLIRDGAGASIYDILCQIDAGKRAHSGGLRWAQDAVSGMLMVREPTHVRLTIAATDNAFLDYWESRFELTECTPL